MLTTVAPGTWNLASKKKVILQSFKTKLSLFTAIPAMYPAFFGTIEIFFGKMKSGSSYQIVFQFRIGLL